MKRPKAEDYDYSPHSFIVDLQKYVDHLEGKDIEEYGEQCNVIDKDKYITWLTGLRDSSDDEQVKDVYDSLILDTKKLW